MIESRITYTYMIKKGFTLLEILLVIAAIGILAAIVIVAINPNRQLAQTRDAERQVEVNSLAKALDQYLIDNGEYPSSITGSLQEVCAPGGSSGCTDLSIDLVPMYLAAIPVDPQVTGDGSGYSVAVNPVNNAISVRASSAERAEVIAINPLPAPSVFESCLDALNQGQTSDGVYQIDPDGEGGLDAFDAECDMTTDGGGWTLVLNYNHLGGTNPALDVRTTDLPVISTTSLGVDESGSPAWGHAGNALLSEWIVSDIRFYGVTSAHSRVIHFKTSLATCISYFQTGTGDCMGIENTNVELAGHSANIPNAVADYFTDQGDLAMTEFPYWLAGTYHWGIRGLGSRWEVDDYPNDASQSTYHQIWIR
jgi:prepilin-type N-terminal cleavage/methylation domain-containing protein